MNNKKQNPKRNKTIEVGEQKYEQIYVLLIDP